MSRDHTFVHSTFLQTATGKGIAGTLASLISMQWMTKIWHMMTKILIDTELNIDTDDNRSLCMGGHCHHLPSDIPIPQVDLIFSPVPQVDLILDQYQRNHDIVDATAITDTVYLGLQVGA